MSQSNRKARFRTLPGLILSTIVLSAAANAKEWSFMAEPYVLAANIDGNAGFGRITGANVAINFSDILESLEAAAMVHFEAHHDSGWGVSLDYSFMDLADDLTGPRDGVISAELHQGILEGLLMRRFESDGGTVDYFAGVRWWDNDIDVVLDPVLLPGTITPGVEQDWVDFVIGARWIKEYSNGWGMQFRADIGGLDLESDFTSIVSFGGTYRFNETFLLDLQYKAAWVDFDTGVAGQPDYFKYDTVTHGPLVGLIIEF